LTRKFNLEKKMRDALARVNGSQPTVSKQSEEQLEASNRKVDTAQRELWRVSERSNEVHRKLLEHRAGVLSINVRNLERKMNKGNGAMNGDDSGYNTPNQSGTLSPIASSVTSTLSSSKPRFDHFFAGHVDSVVPKARRAISPADLIALEEKLKTATDALASAEEERAKVTQELSRIRLEKEQIETMMGMELQSAEDKVVAMEEDISALRESDAQLRELLEERTTWERDRVALMDRSRQVEDLERRVKALDQQGGQAQILELKMQLDAERRETASLRSELEEGRVALRNLVQSHGMSPIVKNISLPELIAPLGSHLASTMAKAEAHTLLKQEWETTRRKLEEDVRAGQDKREALYREVEEARNEREEARRELRAAETRSKVSASNLMQPGGSGLWCFPGTRLWKCPTEPYIVVAVIAWIVARIVARRPRWRRVCENGLHPPAYLECAALS
jgi:predicted  nucleic acid-binding Zn-ribbon protein